MPRGNVGNRTSILVAAAIGLFTGGVGFAGQLEVPPRRQVPVNGPATSSDGHREMISTSGTTVSSTDTGQPRSAKSARGDSLDPGRRPAAAVPIQLSPRIDQRRGEKSAPGPANSASVSKVFLSLILVLGLFLSLSWIARKSLPRSSLSLPPQVVEPLGAVAMGNKQRLQLLRVGRRLLLVSVTPSRVETLTEITDTDEVERLLAICQRERPDSASASFRQVLQQMAQRHAAPSLTGAEDNVNSLADYRRLQATRRG